jgi:hypothetical protein
MGLVTNQEILMMKVSAAMEALAHPHVDREQVSDLLNDAVTLNDAGAIFDECGFLLGDEIHKTGEHF